jgi:hypothetical protein
VIECLDDSTEFTKQSQYKDKDIKIKYNFTTGFIKKKQLISISFWISELFRMNGSVCLVGYLIRYGVCSDLNVTIPIRKSIENAFQKQPYTLYPNSGTFPDITQTQTTFLHGTCRRHEKRRLTVAYTNTQ